MKSNTIQNQFFSGVLVLFMVFNLSGCSKKPIEKSYWSENGQSLPSFSGTDKDTGINWTIANDSTYLFLSLNTNNREIQRMVMFRGITLYLDPSGRKKKDIYLRYPYLSDPAQAFRENRSMADGDQRHRPYHAPTTAYWKKGDDGMLLNSAMIHSEFSYNISIDSLGIMDYQVRIPLNRIEKSGYEDIKELSVGIVVDRPEMRPGSKPQFRPHGGFADGDGGGERGGFGDRDGGRRQPPDGRDRSRFHPVNVNIWFLTRLAQPS